MIFILTIFLIEVYNSSPLDMFFRTILILQFFKLQLHIYCNYSKHIEKHIKYFQEKYSVRNVGVIVQVCLWEKLLTLFSPQKLARNHKS